MPVLGASDVCFLNSILSFKAVGFHAKSKYHPFLRKQMKGSLDPEPVLLSRAASVPLPRLRGQGRSHSSLGLHWCSADRRNMLLSVIYTLRGQEARDRWWCACTRTGELVSVQMRLPPPRKVQTLAGALLRRPPTLSPCEPPSWETNSKEDGRAVS